MASDVSNLLTFDLVGLAILTRDDIILHKRMEEGFTNIELLLPRHVDNQFFTNLSVNDACLAHGRVLVYNSINDMYGNDVSYKLKIAPADLGRFLSKEAKALLKPLKKKNDVALPGRDLSATGLPSVSVTDLCMNPDEKPQFQVPGRSLTEYMTL